MTLKSVEALAMKLPASSRGKLAAKLLKTLDADGAADNERLWIEEADRRYRAYKAGQIRTTDAREAIAAARAAFRS